MLLELAAVVAMEPMVVFWLLLLIHGTVAAVLRGKRRALVIVGLCVGGVLPVLGVIGLGGLPVLWLAVVVAAGTHAGIALLVAGIVGGAIRTENIGIGVWTVRYNRSIRIFEVGIAGMEAVGYLVSAVASGKVL